MKKYCELCVVCKKNKAFRHKLYKKLRFLLKFKYKWIDIFMNFVTGLLESKNWNDAIYNFIFVVINRFFKIIHYVLCSKTISAENLIEIFIKEIVRLYEISTLIISDRESIFIFKFWTTLCYVLKVTKNLFTTFYF